MPINSAARKAVARAEYGTCDYWRALDAMYETLPDSPLHHDNRCNDCRSVTFYGSCGVEGCADCLPLFDADNREIPGTSDPETATSRVSR